jgi:hypothetical protein
VGCSLYLHLPGATYLPNLSLLTYLPILSFTYLLPAPPHLHYPG